MLADARLMIDASLGRSQPCSYCFPCRAPISYFGLTKGIQSHAEHAISTPSLQKFHAAVLHPYC